MAEETGFRGGSSGRLVRISGPIVESLDMKDVQMYEVVHVGSDRLVGEVIRIDGERATIQVYERTTGLKPGQPVYSTGRPLSVSLGPGMIGNIYDGIQRPLKDIQKKSGIYIRRGEKAEPIDMERRWAFSPTVERGQRIGQGEIFGAVRETEMITHRLLVPPEVEGEVLFIAPKGEYSVQEPLCKIDAGNTTVTLKGFQMWPVRKPRPYRERLEPRIPLVTGLRIIDTFFPIPKGGTACVPGGFGTGKTMTQHSLAKWCNADIIVYIGCGERGNEMTDVLNEFPQIVDPRSGKSLMERTILIANTSNMPVAAREVSIYTGITLAEYFRDMGYHVAVMADSTSRWAEALRELSGRLEEMPAEEGFPAYLPTRLAEFYERGGYTETLGSTEGSVTIVGSVSPPGGDFSEPVTQHTKRFIRCFWALDTVLANARHYPSIHWLTSYSEYVEEVEEWWRRLEPGWAALRNNALEILQKEDKLQQIVKLVGPDVLPDSQRFILFLAELIKNGFLEQNAFDAIDMFCFPEKQVLLLKILLLIYHRGLRVIEKGAPLVRIREIPVIDRIIRAKSVIPNDNLEGLEKLLNEVNAQFDQLERSYA